jgi:hypothetical protein
MGLDPPVNLYADFGDHKGVPSHADEARHLQNAEHRARHARRQNILFAASVWFEPNFFHDPGQRLECVASRGN